MRKTFKKTILSIIFLLIWTAAAYIFSQNFITFIFKLILGNNLSRIPWLTVCEIVAYLFAVFLAIILPHLLFKKYHTSREELGLKGDLTWSGLLLAPAGFIAYAILAAILIQVFSLFPWFNADEAQTNLILNSNIDRLLTFFVTVIIAPIAEELVFRGWLYGKLRKTIPKKSTSIIISSLLVSVLFGLLHFQWNVGVNVFCLSLVLCGLRELTGNIYSGIFLHMLKNGIAFYLLWIL